MCNIFGEWRFVFVIFCGKMVCVNFAVLDWFFVNLVFQHHRFVKYSLPFSTRTVFLAVCANEGIVLMVKVSIS